MFMLHMTTNPDSFLEDLVKNFLNEKTIHERENQIEAFKTKFKAMMGRSLNQEDSSNIIKLKNDDFGNEITKQFNKFRNKRISAITESTNIELERRVFLISC